MNTETLVQWQVRSEKTGLVKAWWTHPFLEQLETWNLKDVHWLEFGSGRSCAYLRSMCKWVDSIEANREWAQQAITDCEAAGLHNGTINYNHERDLPDGIQEEKQAFFDLIPKGSTYHIISVDGSWRNECLQFAIDHFKGRGGILIADNFSQDYVWISPAAEELMKPYKEHVFFQPGHTDHEGRPWNTRYWIIPA